nr:MAG TPA: hypothetical protein [Caudoviricetes sp.]
MLFQYRYISHTVQTYKAFQYSALLLHLQRYQNSQGVSLAGRFLFLPGICALADNNSRH